MNVDSKRSGIITTRAKRDSSKAKEIASMGGKALKEARDKKADKADKKDKRERFKEEIKEELKAEAKAETAEHLAKMAKLEASGVVEIGGVDRERHDANILRLEWAIKYPLLSPQEFLLQEKDYSPSQAHRIFEVSGGEAEWRDERDRLLNGVTETMIKRNIDKIVEMNETHLKLSQLGMAKIAEMLSKMQIDPVLNDEGKLMIDPKTKKPVYRGFRSIDLVNCMSALEKVVMIQRKVYGLKDEIGMNQIQESIKSSSNNIQININNNLASEEEQPPQKTKIELIVEKLEYEDVAELIKERRAMKKAIEVEYEEKK